MKIFKILPVLIILLNLSTSAKKNDSIGLALQNYPISIISIEPSIGLKPSPMSDLIVSNLVQWKLMKRLCIVSHTSYSFNNVFLREFNYVETDYNYSFGQKFGIGTSLYSNRSSHTFSLMAGIKYDSYKETLANPEFEKVSASVNSLSPDFGLLYNLKKGKKKYYFSFSMYLPLYPYPMISLDTYSLSGNLANISMEFGVGIRLK